MVPTYLKNITLSELYSVRAPYLGALTECLTFWNTVDLWYLLEPSWPLGGTFFFFFFAFAWLLFFEKLKALYRCLFFKLLQVLKIDQKPVTFKVLLAFFQNNTFPSLFCLCCASWQKERYVSQIHQEKSYHHVMTPQKTSRHSKRSTACINKLHLSISIDKWDNCKWKLLRWISNLKTKQ